MKAFLKFLVVFAVILLVTAVLAPWIASFTDFKFHRIITRCIMVQFLAVAVWYYRKLDKSNFRALFTGYGLAWKGAKTRNALLQGFACSFFMLVALMVLEVFLGARILQVHVKSKFLLQLIEYPIAAFIIGFIEEFFFRGMVFKKCERVSVPFAFIFTSAFYSIVHFFKAKHVAVSEIPTIADSFRLMWGLLQPFSDPLAILPGFIGLFIFGLVLSYAYWKTRSLYYSIGIHAGAVFFLKADGWLIHTNPDAPILLYGDKNVYTGILGWIFMAFIGFTMMFLLRKKGVAGR